MLLRLASKLINTSPSKHVVASNLFRRRLLAAAATRQVSSSHGATVQQSMIESILRRTFPKATTIHVQDISGGCGAMFELQIISTEFHGLPKVKQHMLVNKALAAEISNMHGLRIFTDTPDEAPGGGDEQHQQDGSKSSS